MQRSKPTIFSLKGSGNFNFWVFWAVFSALLIALPLMIVFSNIATAADDVWLHIRDRLLTSYIYNTILLLIGVAVLTFLLGLSTSYLVSMYSFPGRNIFAWALILPLSIPAYITGFTWAGILDYTSPVYVFFRDHLGVETGQFLFFNVLSMHGAIIIFSLALYPYVYLITRAWLTRQSASVFEAASSLGRTPWQIFIHIALPMSRPALVAGISLALMEVLNDYGLVRYFGIDTFTIGIFTAWFSFSDIQSALKLSAWLMVFVLLLLSLEKYQRRKMRFSTSISGARIVARKQIRSWKAVLAFVICSVPVLAGFLFPALMLVYWSIQTGSYVLNARFWVLVTNSFTLAGLASLIVVVFSIIIAFTVRSFPALYVRFMARVATLGYALPGAVVAIGILVAFIWMENQAVWSATGIALTGTWFALLYAYLVRFMAVGYNSIESGMEKVPKSLDDASRSLGHSNRNTLTSILLPVIKTSVLSAALLVFIDVLKELPLTLILRPFNFDTLAIRAFEFASDERIAEAAPAALIIIITGLLPILLLNKFMR